MSVGTELKADIGVIGLAVMGQNLILNLNDKGFRVCAYNRTVSKVDDFLSNEAKGTQVIGATSLQDLCSKLKEPRRVLLMVKAGDAVEEFIAALEPFLSAGDVIIDGGNSNFVDTNRRCRELAPKGLHFVGCGVSGGEEGARHGPSMMPGGSEAAWPLVREMFQAIAAKVPKVSQVKNSEESAEVENSKKQKLETSNEVDVCCDWVGPEGSGHFVKMVHNGIEYGDMQLIAEAYDLLKNGLGIEGDELAQIFSDWNEGELSSFLIEITADILKFKDDKGQRVVERIRDAAGQKGTGKWTVMAALDTGTPVTLIGEAVFARALSAMKNERLVASKLLPSVVSNLNVDTSLKSEMISNIRKALYASKIISYTQGFILLKQAAQDYKWPHLNYGGISLMWRGGCIIRSAFLTKIQEAFERAGPALPSLLHDDFFIKAVSDAQAGWRSALQFAIGQGIPVPAMSAALAFYDGYRAPKLPANLIQAQRDYFGAHTFEIEGEEGKAVHVNWTGRGGNVTAGTYQA